MISCFQNAFVPLQKSEIASSSMAFACAGVAGLMPLRGATNAAVLQNSHNSTRGLRDNGIGPKSNANAVATQSHAPAPAST
jgi:hypothetical protein